MVRAGAQLYQNWPVLFGKGALTKIVSTYGVDWLLHQARLHGWKPNAAKVYTRALFKRE